MRMSLLGFVTLLGGCDRAPPEGLDPDDTDGPVDEQPPTCVSAGSEVPYNGEDDDCDPGSPDDDLDGDGLLLAADCDDEDAAVGGEEVPYDGIDQDCDPATPDDDLDGDGFLGVDDCDDTDAEARPDAIDVPRDGIDQDCTGRDLCSAPDLVEDFLTFEGETAVDGMVAFCDEHPDGATMEWLLEVSESHSVDLAELGCLCAVRGDLYLASNADLVSVDGLSALNELGGSVSIFGSDALVSLEGLRSVTTTATVPTAGSGRRSACRRSPCRRLPGSRTSPRRGGCRSA
jgi:hypothetical protein